MFVARGGAGTLQVLKRMIGDAKELEVLEFEKAVKTVGGTRHYDVRVRSGDDEFFIESKYWAQNKAKTHIVNAINIFKKENDEDGPPGQLLKDVLGYMTDKGAGKSVRWEFVEGSTGVDRKALMQTAMETIASNDGGNIQAFIAKQVGKNYSEVEDDVRKALEVILGGVKGVD